MKPVQSARVTIVGTTTVRVCTVVMLSSPTHVKVVATWTDEVVSHEAPIVGEAWVSVVEGGGGGGDDDVLVTGDGSISPGCSVGAIFVVPAVAIVIAAGSGDMPLQ